MKKTLLIIATAILAATIVWFIISTFFDSSYSFVITSETDAKISVAPSSSEPFQVIGTGTVEYTTKQTGAVYVRAEKEDLVTLQSVFPVDSDGQVIELVLFDTKDPVFLLENPITSPLLENNVVYGVYELNNQMINVALIGDTPPEYSFVSIPYVDSVVWLDSNNYHYNKFRGGVGTVINDNNEGELFLQNHLAWGEETALSVSKSGTGPLVLLSSDSLYVSTDFGKSLKRISEVQPSEVFFLDTDSEYVYYGKNMAPSEYASEGGGEEDTASASASALTIYDYSGNTILHTELQGVSTITGVASYVPSSEFFVTTNRGLLRLGQTGETTKTYSFPFTLDDIIVYKDDVYVFSGNGMWQINLSSGAYSLVYGFDSSSYVARSVQPGKIDGEILFTTLNSSVNYGALYKLSLK